jgi:hypothetical protein
MTFAEFLEHLRFSYHAEMVAVCQSGWGQLLDPEKVDNFPSFYDWLLQRYTRFQLSAYGAGRDIQA